MYRSVPVLPYRERQNYLETLIGKAQICNMKKRVTISEPDRRERFMNSFQENRSEDRTGGPV